MLGVGLSSANGDLHWSHASRRKLLDSRSLASFQHCGRLRPLSMALQDSNMVFPPRIKSSPARRAVLHHHRFMLVHCCWAFHLPWEPSTVGRRLVNPYWTSQQFWALHNLALPANVRHCRPSCGHFQNSSPSRVVTGHGSIGAKSGASPVPFSLGRSHGLRGSLPLASPASNCSRHHHIARRDWHPAFASGGHTTKYVVVSARNLVYPDGFHPLDAIALPERMFHGGHWIRSRGIAVCGRCFPHAGKGFGESSVQLAPCSNNSDNLGVVYGAFDSPEEENVPAAWKRGTEFRISSF